MIEKPIGKEIDALHSSIVKSLKNKPENAKIHAESMLNSVYYSQLNDRDALLELQAYLQTQ